jgi:hypothetical protein
MFARPHTLARWMRLMLACLALFAGGTSARAMVPEVAAVVAVSAQRHAPEHPLSTGVFVRGARGSAEGVRLPARASFTGRVPEVHPPGPPRRLFLVHRALLR